jgi:hypothetical protein
MKPRLQFAAEVLVADLEAVVAVRVEEARVVVDP